MSRWESAVRRAAGFGALAVVLAAAPALARGSSSDDTDFEWTWTLRAGQKLEVRGLNGGIHVRAASGHTARVIAEKSRGRRCDPGDVRIEVVEDRDGVTVCALYPRKDGRENVCGEKDQSNDNCDVEVEFTVEVPAGVKFNGHTVNGDVKAAGLRGPVELTTVNGSISVETTSWASATTVNGSINASLGAESWDEALEFTTVNGGIDLQLPRDVSAEVRGELMNGSLDSDFPVTARRRAGMRRVRGTIGDGGSPLELTTVNGDLVLRVRS